VAILSNIATPNNRITFHLNGKQLGLADSMPQPDDGFQRRFASFVSLFDTISAGFETSFELVESPGLCPVSTIIIVVHFPTKHFKFIIPCCYRTLCH
jgi:hypothetical protein